MLTQITFPIGITDVLPIPIFITLMSPAFWKKLQGMVFVDFPNVKLREVRWGL